MYSHNRAKSQPLFTHDHHAPSLRGNSILNTEKGADEIKDKRGILSAFHHISTTYPSSLLHHITSALPRHARSCCAYYSSAATTLPLLPQVTKQSLGLQITQLKISSDSRAQDQIFSVSKIKWLLQSKAYMRIR